MKYHNAKGNKILLTIYHRTPRRHCFKAENFMCQPPTKQSRVFGYRNYSGLIFVGWLNGLIIVSITNVPPSRHVSSRRYKHIQQLP